MSTPLPAITLSQTSDDALDIFSYRCACGVGGHGFDHPEAAGYEAAQHMRGHMDAARG